MNKGPNRRKLIILGIIVAIVGAIVVTGSIGCRPEKSASPTQPVTVPSVAAENHSGLTVNAAILSSDTSSKEQPGAAPSVITSRAVDIMPTSAALRGNFTSLGSAQVVNLSFQWGTASGSYTDETPPTTMGTTAPFQANIIGLTTGTTYYYRAKAVGAGTAYGTEMSFIAGQAGISSDTPAITTSSTLDVTANSATLMGNLDSLGRLTSMNVSFQWGTAPGSYTGETNATTMGTTALLQANITGLKSGTMYYYRAKGTDGTITVYGTESSFTTR